MKIFCQPVQDRSLLLDLFRAYPFKIYQHNTQGIDKERLTVFLLDNYMKLAADDEVFHVNVKQQDRVLGLATVIKEKLHSTVYGIGFGTISHLLSYHNPGEVTPLLINDILAYTSQHHIECIRCRLDGEDFENLRVLERAGFSIVDCSIKMSVKTGDIPLIHDKSKEDFSLHPYGRQDFEEILAIAAEAPHPNPFYNDRRLPVEKTDALFQQWVERCCTGLAECFLVIRLGDTIAGFVNLLENKALNERLGLRIGILDYIILTSSFRGKGLARKVLCKAFANLSDKYDRWELRTSQNNYAALRLYCDLGLRVVSTDFIMHRWQE